MRTGRCQCGEIHYESNGDPLSLYICHCLECQKQSASAFGISLDVERDGFKITKGIPKYWYRNSDAGRKLKCAFCPTCGSRLWHETESSKAISIKVGSLDLPVDCTNAIHVWVRRKLQGIVIPSEAKQYQKED